MTRQDDIITAAFIAAMLGIYAVAAWYTYVVIYGGWWG